MTKLPISSPSVPGDMQADSVPLVSATTNQGICTLTLMRAQAYNALSDELIAELSDCLDSIARDDQIRVVVLRGDGRGFCAGHDLKQMMQDDDAQRQQQTFDNCSVLMQKINNLPQPVIAQVQGIATAAGCQLVASCDLAVAEQSARFATPGVNIGLFCSTPMVALTRTISKKHAMEMLLLGEMISAERAYQIGLINRVVATDQLESAVQAMAQNIAAKSSYCVSTGKQAFYSQLNQPLDAAYANCSKVMGCNIQHADAKEGIDAFLNKRAPRWHDQ
ncbi:MAG: enoyl-CoA hydratase [Motiliproteus sp.]